MKTASLLLTLQLVASLWLSSASGLVCSPNQYAWTGHCCSRCPAGTHMQSRCTSTKDTLCRSCLQEIEYNPEWNTKYQCESCRQCVNQFIYKRHCNLTTDSQCLCIAGKRCWDEGCTRCITDIPASTPDAGVPTATEKEQHTWPVQKSEKPPRSQDELVLLMAGFLSLAFLITFVCILHRRGCQRDKAGKAGLCTGSGFPNERPLPKILQAQETDSLCHCSEEEEGNAPVQEEYRKPEWELETSDPQDR
uniref:CD27 antigen-like isoform X1 n=1 Tax=Geotrypetes seraphini TaxID=260995 RepID=A0A6P8PX30_GEOSA|nr:CD27 antigen-like isoform X1 [Geotrypetes seraphini]